MSQAIKELYKGFFVGRVDPTTSTFKLPLNAIYLDTTNGKFYRYEGKKDGFKDLLDIDDGNGSGDGDLKEKFIHFTGDGETTDFDCDESIDVIRVDIDGVVVNDDDYDKDDEVIKFKEAPKDGAEITVYKVYLD